jgi:hypothetical protein
VGKGALSKWEYKGMGGYFQKSIEAGSKGKDGLQEAVKGKVWCRAGREGIRKCEGGAIRERRRSKGEKDRKR